MSDDDKKIDETIDVPEQTEQERLISEATAEFKTQISGLTKKNQDLMDELKRRDQKGQSVEERLAALEKEKEAAERRAASVEAFSKAGLPDVWREVFTINDPTDRALRVTELLDAHAKEVGAKIAAEFGREPAENIESGKRTYTVDELAGKTPEEINRLWNEGKISGVPKS